MRRRRVIWKPASLGAAVLLIVGAGAVGRMVPQPSAPPQERRIKMTVRQYAYDPAVLRVNLGDTVRLRATSVDVIHGLYLEGYDLNIKIIPDSPYLELSYPSRPEEPAKKVEEVVFVADRTGKFRYRCSHTCGAMHPFMQGELLVAPNRLLGAGVGGLVGLLLAAAFTAGRRIRGTP
jgi:heme/copper-type cytochrome/quinol oxidase subunit 2